MPIQEIDYDPFAEQYVKEKELQKRRNILEVDYDPFVQDEDSQAAAPPKREALQPPASKVGTLGGVASALGQGIAEGVTTALPEMAGEALEFAGTELLGETVAGIGRNLKEWSEAKGKALYGEPKKREGLERWVYDGSKMLAPSVIPAGAVGAGVRILTGVGKLVKAGKAAQAAGDAAKAAEYFDAATKAAKLSNNVASASTAGLFGTSQAQSTRDTAEKQAAKLEAEGDFEGARQAREAGQGWAPYASGAIEAGGEFFGTKYLGKLFRLDEAGVAKRGAKQLVKDFLKTLGVEVGTEMGQQGGEAAVEKVSGIRPDADPLAEALDVIGPTGFMTLLTFGMAGAVNRMRRPDDTIDLMQDEKDKDQPDISETIKKEIEKARKAETKAKPRPSTAKEAAETFFGKEAVENEQAIDSLRRRGLYVPEDQPVAKSAEESAQVFEAEQARQQGEAVRAAAPPSRVAMPIGEPQLGVRPEAKAVPEEIVPTGTSAGTTGTIAEMPLFEPETEIERIDQAGNAAATSPLNERPQPTEAQKQAGNYAKGHISYKGLDISIENPRGSERSGTDKAGKPWSIVMEHPYGYIRGTQGRDKDHLDVFIGPDTESDKAFVVDQINPETGKWDEHKILLGFNTEEEARKGYLDNYQEGWKGLGAITEMPVDEFKAWAKSGPKTKPVAYKEAKNAGEVSGNQRSDVRKEEGGVEKAAPGAGVVLGGEKAPVRREPILGGENLQFTEKTGGEAGERAGLTPEAKPAEGEKKEPWQMTAAEYEETLPMDTRIIPPQRKRQGASIVRLSEDETVTTSEHGKAVFEAIRAGKPVPAEVIAEYPELTKKEEKPAPKPSEKPTFRQFIEAKGIAWPVKTSDPRYKVLKEEYDAVKAIPPAVVETLTEESKEEKAEPAPQPEARGELAPELKSLILMDMKTALEEGHKYGMRDDETVGQGSNQVPIGTTNPPWLMDIIRAMKAKNKQTTGKTEILAVIKKELEGKGDTFSPKQLKLWFIIEDHLREESGKPHYTKAAEIMSGTMETLIDDYNEGADIGQYDDSDLEFPPTEKEIETAAVNVVSEEVANGNEAALQTYQAERGEARKEENEAPAAETGPAEEVKPKTKEPWELTSADLIKVDEKRLPRGTYRGLLLDANGEYVGDVHLVDGKVHVVDKKPYGRGEIIARLPDTYAPGLLKKSHSLRISDTQTDSYWTFRKPESEPEPKTEPTKAGTQGVIPGASEAETFMLTGAPGEVGTSAPTTGVPKTGELFAEEKAKFPEYTPAISIDAKRRLNTLAGKANLKLSDLRDPKDGLMSQVQADPILALEYAEKMAAKDWEDTNFKNNFRKIADFIKKEWPVRSYMDIKGRWKSYAIDRTDEEGEKVVGMSPGGIYSSRTVYEYDGKGKPPAEDVAQLKAHGFKRSEDGRIWTSPVTHSETGRVLEGVEKETASLEEGEGEGEKPKLPKEPFTGYNKLVDIENNLGIFANRSIPDSVKRDATKLIEAIKAKDTDTISKIAKKYQGELGKGDVQGGPKEVKVGDIVKTTLAHTALREGNRILYEASEEKWAERVKTEHPPKQPWEMQKKDFIKDSELSVINNEKEGPKPNKYKEGDLAIDDYGENPYVYQMQYLDPQKIEFGLEGETRQRVIDMPSTQKYIEWSKQGIEPSPITVVLQGDKKTPYSTNRRRVIAAQESGAKKIPAFVEIGRHKDMIQQAVSDGLPVPQAVLDEYPELKPRPSPTEDAGEKGKLKIGDEQRIMGNDAVVAKIETHDGVSYALLNAAKLSDKRGYIRVFDEDSGNVVSVNEFPTYDAAETKYNQTVADAKKVAGGKIEDFGEKIGGARKDTAERGYSMSGKAKKEETGPAWRKKFVAMEKVHEPGKWVIGTAGAAKSGMMTRFGGQVFSSQEEAEKAIPLYAVAQNHSVYQNDDKTYSIYKRVSDRKRLKIVNQDFPSREEAMKYMALHAEELLNLKTNFGEEILPVPEIAVRKGEERRTKDATPEMFMETFAPRGIEFGNWNNQEERQQVMNHAYDGLLDLADALGLPPKALMLNGELAIAFGARGQGLTGAKAHYETDYGIINLTKMKGAGSLGHEFFHALDHYLGRQDTPERGKRVPNKRGDMVFPTTASGKEYATEGLKIKDSGVRTELKEAFETLLQTMYKRAEQYVEDTRQADKFLGKAREHLAGALNNIRGDLSRDLTNYHKSKGGYSSKPIKFFEPASAEQLAEFDRLASILVEGGSLDTKFMSTDPAPGEPAIKRFGKARPGAFNGRHTNDTLEAINTIIKAARNHQGFNKEQTGSLDKVRAAMGVYKARIKMFEEAEAGTEKTRMRPTSYAIEAKKMDQARTGDYWSEPREMAARAFAAYVEDKIAEKGGQSDFLVYHAHGGFLLPMIDGFVARPYPEGAEREAINKAFDKFISTIQTRETPQGVEMYEVRDAIRSNASFSEQLDDFAAGKIVNRREPITVGKTPAVLEMLGAEQVPLVITQGTVEKATSDKHGISIETLKKLPAAIEDPIMVFESATEADSLVVMTELRQDGKSIVAAVRLSKDIDKNVVNDIISVHPRNSEYHFINWINHGLLRYQNKQKSRAWSLTSGLQLPGVSGTVRGVKNKIRFSHDLVKWVNEKTHLSVLSEFSGGHSAYFQEALDNAARSAEDLADVLQAPSFFDHVNDLLKIKSVSLPALLRKATDVVNRFASASESGVDSVRENAKALSDILQRHPLTHKPFGSLDAKTKRLMLSHVFRLSKNAEVLRSVVQLIPVDVMDNLGRIKMSPEYLFGNPSMIRAALSGNLGDKITSGIYSPDNFARTVALAGAEASARLARPDLIRPSQDRPTAETALNRNLSHADNDTRLPRKVKRSSVRDLHRRGLLKPAKLDDVKRFFPGQEVGNDRDGNIYVKTRGGAYVTIYKVDHIEANPDVLTVGYGTSKLAPGAVIPGAMGVKATGEYYIKLHRVYGDVWTMAHEGLGHFLEVSGIINERDVEVLKAHIRNLHRDGRWDPANRKDIGGPEDRANFIADRLAIPEQSGPIGRIILRIRAFIDGILEAFGVRSPESILRGIESGRVFERTGREGKGAEQYAPSKNTLVARMIKDKDMIYELYSRAVESNINDPETLTPKFILARAKEMLEDFAENGHLLNEDLNSDDAETAAAAKAELAAVRRFVKKYEPLIAKQGDQYFSVLTPDLPGRLRALSDSIVQPGLLQRAWDEFRFQAQDKFHFLNKAQIEAERRSRAQLPESQDAYLAETRYHGMAAAAIEDFDEKHVDPLIELMSENNIDVEQADEYLHARHAKEANARLREINPDREDNQALSGMSDQEAEQILDRINRGPQAQIYKRIGRMVDAITKARRDLLIEAGLETEDTIAKWEKTYQHYVPLMREGKSEAMPRKGRGFEVRGGQKLRAGSTREVVNILANVVAQHEATIVRAEKAKVSRAFLEFAKAHRGPWKIDVPEKTASFDEDGLIVYRANPLGYMLAENVLAVRVDGKDHHITFDERDLDGMKILSALKNLDAADMGAVTRAVAKISRWLAVINTSLNPEFIISNFARDIQTAAYNMADNEADAIRMKAIKQVGSAFKGIREYQDNNRDTEWARWFNRFRNAGGQTGWIQSYETIQDREKALISKIEDMKHGKIRSVKRGLTAAFDYIADMNTAVENAIRLSVFKNLIEADVPESKAAKIAKELTVNFNRKGNMGPVLNAFYLFYNASIQGSARLIMAGAKSRKVRMLMGATIVFAAALDIMNRAVGGDDDDGENRYDKIAPWIKDRNMIIMLPGSGGYLQIPLPWGYNIFHVMGQAAGEVLTKKNNKATASALRVGGAIVSAFNPMGGESSLLQMISPTLLDPFVQWAENKDWSGRKLRPSANPYAEKPSSQTYWHSARVPSKWIAKTLNELTGGDEVRPGKIDISPESIDLAIDTVTGGAGKFVSNLISTPIKYAKGEDVETYEIPFLRRVYGKAGKQVLTQEYYENMDSVRLVQRQLSHYKNDPAKVREIAQEYKSEVRLIGRMKATQKAMKDLKDQLKAAEMIKDPDVRKAREKKIEETMEKIMTGFNKNYNLMKNRED